MNNSHMVMVATKQPNKPVTVDGDIFTGTKNECKERLMDSLDGVLAKTSKPIYDNRNPETCSLYWAPDNWVKLLVVPTVDIETK